MARSWGREYARPARQVRPVRAGQRRGLAQCQQRDLAGCLAAQDVLRVVQPGGGKHYAPGIARLPSTRSGGTDASMPE
jgi:hypothetical protein